MQIEKAKVVYEAYLKDSLDEIVDYDDFVSDYLIADINGNLFVCECIGDDMVNDMLEYYWKPRKAFIDNGRYALKQYIANDCVTDYIIYTQKEGGDNRD